MHTSACDSARVAGDLRQISTSPNRRIASRYSYAVVLRIDNVTPFLRRVPVIARLRRRAHVAERRLFAQAL
jgi:hypothetical protein